VLRRETREVRNWGANDPANGHCGPGKRAKMGAVTSADSPGAVIRRSERLR